MKYSILHNTVSNEQSLNNCIKINPPKKYIFVYDVQRIKQTIHEHQDLKNGQCTFLNAEKWAGSTLDRKKWAGCCTPPPKNT